MYLKYIFEKDNDMVKQTFPKAKPFYPKNTAKFRDAIDEIKQHSKDSQGLLLFVQGKLEAFNFS